MDRKHGIDFGRWRQWAMPDNPPKPIDFVIAGATSGDHVNQMWEANRLALKDYRDNGGVLGLYHFYEPVNNISQLEAFMACVEELKPQFVALDWENSGSYTAPISDLPKVKELFNMFYEAFDHNKVLMYSSHNSWVEMRAADPDWIDSIELWLSWPNLARENTVAFHPNYKDRMGRPFNEVRMFQYSWEGDAQAYGVLNSPPKLDLNVYVHNEPFEDWLGVVEEPEPPEEEPDMGILERIESKLDDALVQLESLQVATGAILSKIDGVGGTDTPPDDNETPDEDWYAWQDRPMEEWPSTVGGLRVAYVETDIEKLPLWDGEDSLYEDENLRAWSDPDNKDSIRIIVKPDVPVQVYADGPDYAHAVDGVRPYQMGGFFGFLVMHEQEIDGIKLRDKLEGTQKVFVPVSQVRIVKK